MTTTLLHVRIRGWTATFRLPLLYSGTGISSPVPPYSTLLGMMGCIAGRQLAPDVTRIGYVFKSDSAAIDLETTKRFSTTDKGRLVPNTAKGDAIAKRQFLVKPELDLYLDNLSLRSIFEHPANIPTLGRSQDLCWIEFITEVEAESISSGMVRGSLVRFPAEGASGVILLLPDWLDNSVLGYARETGRLSKYQAVRYEMPSRNVKCSNLYKVSDREEAIFLNSLI
jgi:CRISPR-associated protein Cas5t